MWNTATTVNAMCLQWRRQTTTHSDELLLRRSLVGGGGRAARDDRRGEEVLQPDAVALVLQQPRVPEQQSAQLEQPITAADRKDVRGGAEQQFVPRMVQLGHKQIDHLRGQVLARPHDGFDGASGGVVRVAFRTETLQ